MSVFLDKKLEILCFFCKFVAEKHYLLSRKNITYCRGKHYLLKYYEYKFCTNEEMYVVGSDGCCCDFRYIESAGEDRS